jgi:predicted ArsR family transcriptional regulator
MSSDVEVLGLLAEPQRLRLYEHLLSLREPVTAADLQAPLGMSRTLLTFHLGRLADGGLLEVVPPEPGTGRRGRPAQRYRASSRELSVSVPARRYELMAELLLQAAAEGRTVEEVARRRGVELAGEEPVRRRPTSVGGRLSLVARLLERLGYAPRRQGPELVLGSCPFDRLRETNLELVCSANLALAEGYLAGLQLDDSVEARLQPCPGTCCVVIAAR